MCFFGLGVVAVWPFGSFWLPCLVFLKLYWVGRKAWGEKGADEETDDRRSFLLGQLDLQKKRNGNIGFDM